MGPSSLDDEMGSRGSREDKTQRTWRLTNSHTRLEGSVISSPNCTTPVRYHDKMTIIIILESDSTTITDSIAITDSISMLIVLVLLIVLLVPIVLLLVLLSLIV